MSQKKRVNKNENLTTGIAILVGVLQLAKMVAELVIWIIRITGQ